jgi:hypothetical protein
MKAKKHSSQKKRTFRKAHEEDTKRVKAEEGDYRERVRREREEGRLEGLVANAMRIAEQMSSDLRQRVRSERTIVSGRGFRIKPVSVEGQMAGVHPSATVAL